MDNNLDSNYKYAWSLLGNDQQDRSETDFFNRWFERVSIDGLTILLSTLYIVSIFLLTLGIFLQKIRRWLQGILLLWVIFSFLCFLGFS